MLNPRFSYNVLLPIQRTFYHFFKLKLQSTKGHTCVNDKPLRTTPVSINLKSQKPIKEFSHTWLGALGMSRRPTLNSRNQFKHLFGHPYALLGCPKDTCFPVRSRIERATSFAVEFAGPNHGTDLRGRKSFLSNQFSFSCEVAK